MMQTRDLHRWRVSYDEAVEIQERLRRQIELTPRCAPPRLVAGTDVAYSRRTHRLYAAVCSVSLPAFTPVETAVATIPARFPYIPGLFAFRELPPLIKALGRIRHDPDVFLFDGHGLAHPRLFGLACHAGLLLNRPSVGCAKSRLVGVHGPVGPHRGSYAELRFRESDVGAVLRTRTGVKPVFVSPGHRVDLATSIAIVMACTPRYRLPEPIRLAHRATTLLRRRIDDTLPTRETRTYRDFVAG